MLPAAVVIGAVSLGVSARLASGLFNTTQQIGMATGVAVLSTLAASRTESLLAAGQNQPTALTGGYHLAFIVGTGLVVAAFMVAFIVLRQPKQAPIRPAPDDTPPLVRTAAA
jgi:multisubunit Na+/H+ antiporter MnhE subunit